MLINPFLPQYFRISPILWRKLSGPFYFRWNANTQDMNRRILYINIIIGVIIVLFPIVSSPDFSMGISMFSVPPFQRSLMSYLLILVFYLVNFYHLVPQFYFKKRYVLYAVICLLCFLLISFWPNLTFPNPIEYNRMRHPIRPGPPGLFGLERYAFQFMLAMGLSLLLRINMHLDEIRNEKLNSELSFIKAKINPHFLFNTLNSVYSLAIKKSDETEEAILKISNIMRYMVSESEKDFVPLSKELAYIRDYIQLQQLRLDHNTELTANIPDCPKPHMIAPLILITFIENAFKYGVNPDKPSEIRIDIFCDADGLYLHAKNTVVANSNSIQNQSTQTGSKSTKRILEAIYGNKFHLETNQQNNVYSVNLKIRLT